MTASVAASQSYRLSKRRVSLPQLSKPQFPMGARQSSPNLSIESSQPSVFGSFRSSLQGASFVNRFRSLRDVPLLGKLVAVVVLPIVLVCALLIWQMAALSAKETDLELVVRTKDNIAFLRNDMALTWKENLYSIIPAAEARNLTQLQSNISEPFFAQIIETRAEKDESVALFIEKFLQQGFSSVASLPLVYHYTFGLPLHRQYLEGSSITLEECIEHYRSLSNAQALTISETLRTLSHENLDLRTHLVGVVQHLLFVEGVFRFCSTATTISLTQLTESLYHLLLEDVGVIGVTREAWERSPVAHQMEHANHTSRANEFLATHQNDIMMWQMRMNMPKSVDGIVSFLQSCEDMIFDDQGLLVENAHLMEDASAGAEHDLDNTRAELTVYAILLSAVLLVTIFLVAFLYRILKQAQGKNLQIIEERQLVEGKIWSFFPQDFIRHLKRTDVTSLSNGLYRNTHLCVMFARLQNFDVVSRAGDLPSVYDWVSAITQEAVPIITSFGGFLDKAMSDGWMALFEDGESAVNAAVQMLVLAEKMSLDNRVAFEEPYHLTIGIHMGPVVLGLIGNTERLEGTTIADTVNTAARVQGMCKYYGSKLIVTESVMEQNVENVLRSRFLGAAKMKGKAQSVRIYEIYSTDPPEMVAMKESYQEKYNECLEAYKIHDFDKCSRLIDEMEAAATAAQDPALLLRKRLLEKHTNESTENWKGVDEFKTK